jgi:hypothetical protein
MNAVGVLTTTALAASAVYTSAVSTPTAQSVTTLLAVAVSDQAGTFVVQGAASASGPWFNASAPTTTTANAPTYITIPILFTNYRVVYTNGVTAQTAFYVGLNYSRVGAPT